MSFVIILSKLQHLFNRCAVCETQSNVLAVHSQDMNIPNCPNGWKGIWMGYSFAMVIDFDTSLLTKMKIKLFKKSCNPDDILILISSTLEPGLKVEDKLYLVQARVCRISVLLRL